MALKDKKMPEGREIEPALAEAIRARSKDGRLNCAAAFVLAKEKGIAPLAAGEAADSLGIHLSRCQLGLFGFPGHAKAWERPGWKEADIPNGLEAAVRSALDPDGSLSCGAAWIIADRFGVGKAQVGFLASRLNIKIKRCQLGAF
jgi:hypothetical protein